MKVLSLHLHSAIALLFLARLRITSASLKGKQKDRPTTASTPEPTTITSTITITTRAAISDTTNLPSTSEATTSSKNFEQTVSTPEPKTRASTSFPEDIPTTTEAALIVEHEDAQSESRVQSFCTTSLSGYTCPMNETEIQVFDELWRKNFNHTWMPSHYHFHLERVELTHQNFIPAAPDRRLRAQGWRKLGRSSGRRLQGRVNAATTNDGKCSHCDWAGGKLADDGLNDVGISSSESDESTGSMSRNRRKLSENTINDLFQRGSRRVLASFTYNTSPKFLLWKVFVQNFAKSLRLSGCECFDSIEYVEVSCDGHTAIAATVPV